MASDDVVEPAPESRPMTHGAYTSSILASPLQPSFYRACPACGKRFALKFHQARAHAVVGEVKAYRCQACGREVEYAQDRPAGTV